MNITTTGDLMSPPESQETAIDSSSCAKIITNRQESSNTAAPDENNIQADSQSNQQTSANSNSTSQELMKVFAPVMTQDITLPTSAKKVPMVMVPVPNSQMLMAIPTSTLNKFEAPVIETSREEQQARDLLNWNEGIGSLDGCDLRFRINQLGCLELLDSDDETENHNNSALRKAKNPSAISSSSKKLNHTTSNHPNNAEPNADSEITKYTSSAYSERNAKRAKLDTESNRPRQISPGSSLLQGGPQIRRPRTASSNNLNRQACTTTISGSQLSRKTELQQNSILMEKLLPKQKLNEIKSTKVERWTLDDVKDFVDSIPGCTGYGELFQVQQICGKSLLYLNQRDLIELIGVKLGPAVKIYHAISLLK